MKTFHVIFSEKAVKELSKLDRNTQFLIYNWININLEGCQNPRIKGKALSGNLKGSWRYRVGDYRLIAEIRDNDVIIYMLHIGHRRDVYK